MVLFFGFCLLFFFPKRIWIRTITIIENGFTSAASLQLLQLDSQDYRGLAEEKMFGEVKREVLAVPAWFHPGVQALS